MIWSRSVKVYGTLASLLMYKFTHTRKSMSRLRILFFFFLYYRIFMNTVSCVNVPMNNLWLNPFLSSLINETLCIKEQQLSVGKWLQFYKHELLPLLQQILCRSQIVVWNYVNYLTRGSSYQTVNGQRISPLHNVCISSVHRLWH